MGGACGDSDTTSTSPIINGKTSFRGTPRRDRERSVPPLLQQLNSRHAKTQVVNFIQTNAGVARRIQPAMRSEIADNRNHCGALRNHDALLSASHSGTTCHDRITRNFSPPGVDRRGRSGRDSRGRDGRGWHIDARAGSESVAEGRQNQDTPKGEQRCDNCVQFEAPSTCKTVDGTVAAQGWCIVYAKKPT